MRLYQLTESRLADKPKMGRDLNHLEDLVLFYGMDGALEAADILDDLTNQKDHDITVKWDGKVALYYGRDENGVFGMGTIGNWRKGWQTNAADMRDYIKTAGKGEGWRQVMGDDLFQTFGHLEASVPADFRGFVKGDLIYSPVLSPKKTVKGRIQFSPSQVTYSVDPRSDVGKRVAATDVGMALHLYHKEWGDNTAVPVDDATVSRLNSDSVFAIGQTYAPQAPSLEDGTTDKLRALAKRLGPQTDDAIAKRKGLSDVSNILYTFNNQTMRSGGSDINSDLFMKWLETSKVSTGKQAKLKDYHEQTPGGFDSLFKLFNQVQVAKNHIIDQLDHMDMPIQSWTGDQRGGEGYVSSRNKVKLVPRTRWRPM